MNSLEVRRTPGHENRVRPRASATCSKRRRQVQNDSDVVHMPPSSDASTETIPFLLAERDRLEATDGELLGRTSTIMASYRPALSYQPVVTLPNCAT